MGVDAESGEHEQHDRRYESDESGGGAQHKAPPPFHSEWYSFPPPWYDCRMANEVTVRALTPQQQEAAYLMAQGLNRREIKEKMTDPVSEKSIGAWNQIPEFAAEFEAFKSATRENLEAVVVSAQLEAIGGLSASARQVLVDALGAVDDEGNPNLALRMRAAELYYTKILPKIEAAQAKSEGQVGGAAVIVINMPDAPGQAPVIQQGEVIEGEIVSG